MADDGLDGRSAFHFAFDGRCDASFLACGEDPKLAIFWRIVATISGIGDQALNNVAGERLHCRDDLCQRMAVIRISRQRRDVADELAALGMLDRGGHADLDAELVRFVRLALADAFHFRGMERIDFWPALLRLLSQHPPR